MPLKCSFTSLYVGFISEFIEEVDSSEDLSCDSLAVLATRRDLVEGSINLDFFHDHKGLKLAALHYFSYSHGLYWIQNDAVLNKVTSAISGFLVVTERLHVMPFESRIQHNAFRIYILTVTNSLIFSTLLFHTGTISAHL